MSDLKKLLNPDDREILSAVSAVNWIPKEPAELILPYIPNEEVTEEEKQSVEYRRKKALEVVNGYTDIINKCKETEAKIEEKCKGVKIALLPSKHLNVMEAMERIFGISSEQITFEHYKICCQELARINNNIPSPENL